MELFREKLLEALNQISVFIAERFETTTEEQVAFLKTPLIIPVRRHFHSFEAHCIRSESLFYLLIIPVLSALILYYRQLLAKVLYQLFSW
jgi:hypothetical protein